MHFKNIKRYLIFLLVVFLATYVLWDISVKFANHFRSQGYEIAIRDMIEEASKEDCKIFDVYAGNKKIELINVDCLYREEEIEIRDEEEED